MCACTISNTKFDSKYAYAPTVLPQYVQTFPMRFIATKRSKTDKKSPHISTRKFPMRLIGSEKKIYHIALKVSSGLVSKNNPAIPAVWTSILSNPAVWLMSKPRDVYNSIIKGTYTYLCSVSISRHI